MKKFTVPEAPGKTPFQRFDSLVHAVLRSPHAPAKPKPSPKARKPSR
ncbi:MAG TPA: hypothetical protein VMV31_15230 [Terriglobales bacterium]|nr:hypothetical protein [Terriglobales bacterium]